MRVERERQVMAKRRAAEEETTWMEEERRSAAMKRPLNFSFRLFLIDFSLRFGFRLCKIDFSLEFSFKLTLHISVLSDLFQIGSLKNCKNFRFHIGSDWFRLILQFSHWTFILRLVLYCFQIHFRLLSGKS